MTTNILTQMKDNLEKKQKASNESWILVDKPYFSDSIKYKFDITSAYSEDSD